MDDSRLRPFDDRFRDVRPDSSLWIREHARAPWILDVPFTPDTDGRWTNKRRPDHTAPLEDVTWVASDGLRYLQPEIALMMKSRLAREKDRIDAATTLPLLDRGQRRRLREYLEDVMPQHRWLEDL